MKPGDLRADRFEEGTLWFLLEEIVDDSDVVPTWIVFCKGARARVGWYKLVTDTMHIQSLSNE